MPSEPTVRRVPFRRPLEHADQPADLFVDVLTGPVEVGDHAVSKFIECHRPEIFKKCRGVVLPQESNNIICDCRFSGDFPILTVIKVGVPTVNEHQLIDCERRASSALCSKGSASYSGYSVIGRRVVSGSLRAGR